MATQRGNHLIDREIANLSFLFVELKVIFSSGKRLYLLKVSSMGRAIERTLIEEHAGNLYLLDIDWKRNFIYWANAQGHLVYSAGYSGEKQEIWTQQTGELWQASFLLLFSDSKICRAKRANLSLI